MGKGGAAVKFLHIADLHLGKTIYGVPLLESGDQRIWIDRFLRLAEEVRPDAVVIAGDVYDRSAPSGEAVQLLSHLLTKLHAQSIPVMLVAGNHDSVQRLSFAGELLAGQGVYISSPLSAPGELAHVTLTDEFGPVTFWLMPYVFPALAAQALEDASIRDYNTAVRALLARQGADFRERNVIIAHQNVTAGGADGQRGGSESMVGGVGQVDYAAFDGFDYVALGHIHAAYHVGRETVRYAGSPLCYHFDETRQSAKGPVLVELGPKGSPVRTETMLIPPLHPMRELKGPYEELRDGEMASSRRGEYLRIVLTDRRVSPEIRGFFQDLCKTRDSMLLELCSEYDPHRNSVSAPESGAAETRSTEELFMDFYSQRVGGQVPEERDQALLIHAGELLRRGDTGSAPSPADVEALLGFLMAQEAEK